MNQKLPDFDCYMSKMEWKRESELSYRHWTWNLYAKCEFYKSSDNANKPHQPTNHYSLLSLRDQINCIPSTTCQLKAPVSISLRHTFAAAFASVFLGLVCKVQRSSIYSSYYSTTTINKLICDWRLKALPSNYLLMTRFFFFYCFWFYTDLWH